MRKTVKWSLSCKKPEVSKWSRSLLGFFLVTPYQIKIWSRIVTNNMKPPIDHKLPKSPRAFHIFKEQFSAKNGQKVKNHEIL